MKANIMLVALVGLIACAVAAVLFMDAALLVSPD
jgi:hypothetical protein